VVIRLARRFLSRWTENNEHEALPPNQRRTRVDHQTVREEALKVDCAVTIDGRTLGYWGQTIDCRHPDGVSGKLPVRRQRWQPAIDAPGVQV
jgi:hypothetical protein